MQEKIERIALIATVVVSITISLLDLLGILDSIPWLAGRTSALTLLVVAIVAGYLVSERAGKLERIERLIMDNTERTLASLSGVEARLLPTSEEAFNYMAERVSNAELKIDHSALAPPITRKSGSSKKWEQAITKVLKSNKVMYRYVASFEDKARWERAKLHLTNPRIQKYFVGYYKPSTEYAPNLSFLVIDDKEIIMHYPYEPGQSEMFLSIKHPEVVQLFTAYYRVIWQYSTHLTDETIKLLDENLKNVTA